MASTEPKSLIATTLISFLLDSIIALKTNLPILPNPLIATFTVMKCSYYFNINLTELITFSSVIEKCLYKSFAGAEAPKLDIPIKISFLSKI